MRTPPNHQFLANDGETRDGERDTVRPAGRGAEIGSSNVGARGFAGIEEPDLTGCC
jgi:hypothetical protein